MNQEECFDKKSIQVHIEVLQKVFEKHPETQRYYEEELKLHSDMIEREKIFKCLMGI